jgi:hypothetical protein
MMIDQSQANWQESFVATNLLPLGYNPETDVILLLESGGTPVGVALRHRATFCYLRDLPISPPQSYEARCKRWDEFHLKSEDDNCQQMQQRWSEFQLESPKRRKPS